MRINISINRLFTNPKFALKSPWPFWVNLYCINSFYLHWYGGGISLRSLSRSIGYVKKGDDKPRTKQTGLTTYYFQVDPSSAEVLYCVSRYYFVMHIIIGGIELIGSVVFGNKYITWPAHSDLYITHFVEILYGIDWRTPRSSLVLHKYFAEIDYHWYR